MPRLPVPVLVSIVLFAITHVAGLWQMILLSRTLEAPLCVPYSALAIVYGGIAMMLVCVAAGRHWARLVCTLLTLLGLLFLLPQLFVLDATQWLTASAKTVALVLLNVRASDAWFRRDKNRPPIQPDPAQQVE